MKVSYITNAERYSGVGQRAYELQRRLEGLVDITEWHIEGDKGELRKDGEIVERVTPWPGLFGSKSVQWMRLGRKVKSQELREKNVIYDITNQSLSFLVRRLTPNVLTVHDLIEVTNPQDRRASLLNGYLYSGITKADQIITVSEYVKQQVMQHCNVAEDKITVIHNGMDRDIFFPLDNVTPQQNMVLYVGSEHPRKNLRVVLEVVARLKKDIPDIRLVKVGAAGLSGGRRETEQLIQKLGLEEVVEWREKVEPSELNRLYNEAGVLLFPSKQEGFGLPVLEALAAGCPVVCSNATSLPEVAGEAALLYDPDDVDGMMESVKKLFQDDGLRESVRQKGFAQAEKFSWDTASSQVLEVYKQLS